MKLQELGFNAFFEGHCQLLSINTSSVARVCAEHRESYRIFSEGGEMSAAVSGKFRNECKSKGSFPTVGDWVFCDFVEGENKAVIQGMLPRKSKFSRKIAGRETEEQIMAANIDYAFIVCALNYDYNLRRVERYLTMAWQSGSVPVIVLTKPDLCEGLDEKIGEVEKAAIGVDVHVVNNLSQGSAKALNEYLQKGKTAVLLGSSGAGKSSLINNLAGELLMPVGDLRSGIEKGKHTTTHRQMLVLPEGGLIIDTPGLRELQLWDADEGVENTFSDIEQLALLCKFKNCTHEGEPGCAVAKAIDEGTIDAARLQNYIKVNKEQVYLESKQKHGSAGAEKQKWKGICKQTRKFKKDDYD